MTQSKFPFGQLVMTCGVDAALEMDVMAYSQLQECLNRHATGDWGDVCDEDKQSNDFALDRGLRLLSAYTVAGHKIWIITEADRSATTIMFPSEY